MSFTEVKNIENANLRREIICQRTKYDRLEKDKSHIVSKLRGKFNDVSTFSSFIEKMKMTVSQSQIRDDNRRNAKLRRLQSSVPVNFDNFNKMDVINESGTPLPEDIISFLQFGAGRGIGSSKFGTKIPVVR